MEKLVDPTSFKDAFLRCSEKRDDKEGTVAEIETTDGTLHENLKEKQASPDIYAGDIQDDTPPPSGEYQAFDYPNPAVLVSFFDRSISDGYVTLYPWQVEILEDLGSINKKATGQHPHKFCLLANNGSGKDKFIIAPFAIWFTLTKIKSRVIITTASGSQLTSQTEPYISDLCSKVNSFFGQEVYRIRQRYIKCLLTGSEIRMFATDEAGKAEGYHPMEYNSEMAIIVNEGKSVSEDIHRALRRCTGYNYWLEISSTGEPTGFLYRAATTWPNVKRITSYECPHISEEDREEDKSSDGEHSHFFRSKHLSLFTSVGGQVIIPLELVNSLFDFFNENNIKFTESWSTRIGIDLAAGGAETVLCFTKGNRCIKEEYFREQDTTICADRIEQFLISAQIPKDHPHIYADDGGVGRAIIDMLVRRGWHINRIMNQWQALGNKKLYGNRGAENWYRCKRIVEEKYFDIRTLSQKTIDQLSTRHYKQTLTGGKIYLESKKEAIANGRPSPDRADAFILSLTGLTIDDFSRGLEVKPKIEKNPRITFSSPEEVLRYYEDKITFAKFPKGTEHDKTDKKSRAFNSLQKVMRN